MTEPAMRNEDRRAFVYGRWHEEHDGEDPRVDRPCTGCGRTFAWRGYEPYCGLCFWFPELRETAP